MEKEEEAKEKAGGDAPEPGPQLAQRTGEGDAAADFHRRSSPALPTQSVGNRDLGHQLALVNMGVGISAQAGKGEEDDSSWKQELRDWWRRINKNDASFYIWSPDNLFRKVSPVTWTDSGVSYGGCSPTWCSPLRGTRHALRASTKYGRDAPAAVGQGSTHMQLTCRRVLT